MDAADALLKIHGVPGQVVVEEDAGKLEIDAFPTGSGADQHLGSILPAESLLGGCLCSVISAFEDIDTCTGKNFIQLFLNCLDRAQVGGENNDFFVGVLLPDLAQGMNEHRGL